MKLLHIITDEKFPDAAFKQFENVAPGSSVYLYPNLKGTIKFLKNIHFSRVSKFSFYNRKFISSLEKYDAVILHSMTSFTLELLARASEKVKFIWIGLGYDYYDLICKDDNELLSELTKGLVISSNKKNILNKIKLSIKKIVFPSLKNKIKLINRVDIFCPVLTSEYELIHNKYPDFRPQVVEWNYGAQAEVFDIYKYCDLTINKYNIIIGNSASPNNNHIDIFKKIDIDCLSKNTKIIVPLSYGDNRYRDKIILKGKEFFGDKFVPILDFMSISEYAILLGQCKVMIMNHKRQQGAGNINIGLLMGHKVFLDNENPLAKHYTENGIDIYSIDKLEEELYTPLSQEIKIKNRCKIIDKKSFSNHLEKTKNLIDLIKMND